MGRGVGLKAPYLRDGGTAWALPAEDGGRGFLHPARVWLCHPILREVAVAEVGRGHGWDGLGCPPTWEVHGSGRWLSSSKVMIPAEE